jgi:hypothetical protein
MLLIDSQHWVNQFDVVHVRSIAMGVSGGASRASYKDDSNLPLDSQLPDAHQRDLADTET